MSNSSQIRYLTQQQIDKLKWDACMAASANGLIYGYSFYLDCMAKQWDGLVLNDYEAIMPLTWNKKYGIFYLYQPFSCASLGVFGKSINAEITESFLLNIPSKFRYADISLNYGNLFKLNSAGLAERKNYVLDLKESYRSIYNAFSENTRRNIKKATEKKCSAQKPALADVLDLAQQQLNQLGKFSTDDFKRFSALYNYLEKEKAAVTYGIAAEDGKLLSCCIFFYWQNRAYYILVGNHPESKTTGASHALINAFIKDHAQTNLILDFEGSDIGGLAMFYSSFGAAQENYPAFRYNKLPSVIKWIKK